MHQPTIKRERIFLENPCDIETVFSALKIAEKEEKQYIFMDMLIAHLRMDSLNDLTNICYLILKQLNLINMENKVT